MVTEKDIENIAKLSCLQVSEDELESIKSDMEHILEFARIVCDYNENDAIYQSEDEASDCKLREDKSEPSYPSVEMLSNAPLHKEGFILLRECE